jgi:hypothetical protein
MAPKVTGRRTSYPKGTPGAIMQEAMRTARGARRWGQCA